MGNFSYNEIRTEKEIGKNFEEAINKCLEEAKLNREDKVGANHPPPLLTGYQITPALPPKYL